MAQQSTLRSWLPGIAVARNYERSWLRTDITAGIALTALLIPAGMGYAQAAGLPPETGLYATIVPLIVYALVGPSKILVLGPDSSLAPIIGAAVLPLAAGDPARAVALAGLLAIIMGTILIAGGLLKLGFVTDLLSKPIRLGYLNGIALVVIISQIPKLLGFSVDGVNLIDEVRQTVSAIAGGEIDATAAAVGVGGIVVILAFKLFHSRIPGVLVAVIGSIAVAYAFGLDDEIPMVGALPHGLPAPALGGLQWSDVLDLIGPAAGIALVAFADTGVLSRTFAARRGESVDGSQEMRAIGTANVASGVLGGFPMSASSSRTPVAEQNGAKTQLTGVVGAVLIVVFILVAPGLTGYLPTAALAAVVIVAATSLVDIRSLTSMWSMSRIETGLAIAAFLGVALVGVLEGIVIAIGLSFVAVVVHAWQPYRAELVVVPGLDGYHDLARHPEGHRIPGLVVARFDAQLFFANGALFDDYVRGLVTDAPDPVRWVIVAAEPITGLDTTAMDELVELDQYLSGNEIRLVFAEMKDPVKDKLRQLGLGERFGPDHFFPTLDTAVEAFRSETSR
ncbi:SulP family inorganic anion transporter [Rhodococcus sp. NPDC127528]|uniref:SulP family inorganic anion transporter n=1 Tax=unclassified Rhodococcus (in: high G+C Gram-positive bacteria) TaxID=192944 RepID=UPI003629E257